MPKKELAAAGMKKNDMMPNMKGGKGGKGGKGSKKGGKRY